MTKERKRAASTRSLETKKKILDASEQIFSEQGYDGTSLRTIASQAGVPVGLVHHHGVSKEELFSQTVKRRAHELSDIRMKDLEALKAAGDLTLHKIVDCFIRALVKLVEQQGDQWLCYGRLIAFVSSNPRWRDLARECFDPTAQYYLNEILALYPNTPRQRAATGHVYSVAAMLAFFNAGWRVEALSSTTPETNVDDLITYCAAGMKALLEK